MTKQDKIVSALVGGGGLCVVAAFWINPLAGLLATIGGAAFVLGIGARAS